MAASAACSNPHVFAHTLRFSTRGFLALTKNAWFLEVPFNNSGSFSTTSALPQILVRWRFGQSIKKINALSFSAKLPAVIHCRLPTKSAKASVRSSSTFMLGGGEFGSRVSDTRLSGVQWPTHRAIQRRRDGTEFGRARSGKTVPFLFCTFL